MKKIIAGLILSLGLASYASAEVCSMENGSGGKIVLIVDKDLIGYTYSQNGAMMSLNWAYFEQTDQVFLKFGDGDMRVYPSSKFTCDKKSDKKKL
jgi:hypothetical protein